MEDKMKRYTAVPAAQMPMPGMPSFRHIDEGTFTEPVRQGSEVTYHGNIKSGPQFGAKGVVQKILGHRVVVDLDNYGTWHVPPYLLSAPAKAA
jgi:hypothetical protein